MAVGLERKGKLVYKFLFWFLLISLAPLIVVGWNLVNISQQVLKEQSLHILESRATGFSETTYNYITTFKNVLAVAARLERFSSMDAGLQKEHLLRVMQQYAAFLELSVFNISGQEKIRLGRFQGPEPPMRNFFDEVSFQTALQRGEYVGGLQRFQGLYPTLTIAVPIVESAPNRPSENKGILLGRVSLNGMSTILHQEFPDKDKSQAAVVATDGFLVAHSDMEKAYSRNATLPKEILDVILTQTSDKGGGKIDLKGGGSVLGAYAMVKSVGWIVYVQQPIETAYLAANEMRRQIFRILLYVVAVTILLSLAVAGHITQPIRGLRQAADRLKAGQFENLPEMVTTNDEIGELAQSFIQMSESLKEKTGELMHAKEELEKFTKFLEKRVEARTRELKAAQDELIKKERLAAIGQMASVVGHEIRNPLAVINNSIYFIKTKLSQAAGAAVPAAPAELDPKIVKHIAIIESEIKQANSIINEILTYSRTRELKPEVVSLNAFLEELLSVYPFPPHVQVQKGFDPNNPSVNIDTDEMRQAIRNLIGNGVEVMPKGGAIRVATQVVDAQWVRVDVADSGSGIPQDVIDKIFAPFFTTKARGTGLGLAVVRKVLDRHEGKVEVASEVGKGTVFRLYLPIHKPSAAPAAPTPQPARPPLA